jgi:hypothetical protein
MSSYSPSNEPTVTQAECLRRLRKLGISVTGSRFLLLIQQHGVPHVINRLSCRGGAPNRRYYWSVVEAFFLSFQEPVMQPMMKSNSRNTR